MAFSANCYANVVDCYENQLFGTAVVLLCQFHMDYAFMDLLVFSYNIKPLDNVVLDG